MTRTQLGRRILQLRGRRGLTQEQLAEASAVSCQTIRRVERGAIFPLDRHAHEARGRLRYLAGGAVRRPARARG
jgi:transcriptional regulator with XRE-family HTH domain